jgi:hypothetical protein
MCTPDMSEPTFWVGSDTKFERKLGQDNVLLRSIVSSVLHSWVGCSRSERSEVNKCFIQSDSGMGHY